MIFGPLLHFTPGQNTILRRLTRKYEFLFRLAVQQSVDRLLNVWALARHCASETVFSLGYAKDAVHDAHRTYADSASNHPRMV